MKCSFCNVILLLSYGYLLNTQCDCRTRSKLHSNSSLGQRSYCYVWFAFATVCVEALHWEKDGKLMIFKDLLVVLKGECERVVFEDSRILSLVVLIWSHGLEALRILNWKFLAAYSSHSWDSVHWRTCRLLASPAPIFIFYFSYLNRFIHLSKS